MCKAVICDLVPGKDEGSCRAIMAPVEGSGREIPADLVLIAAGFLGSEAWRTLFGVRSWTRAPAAAPRGPYQTNRERVFAVGDMRRGQSPAGMGHQKRARGGESRG